MKKYTKPMVEVVELTVKESLSAIPAKFKDVTGKFTLGKIAGYGKKNVSVYTAGASTTANSL